MTRTGDILGTLRYMSPEQAAGKSRVLDHHTDIYSLGLTLYELLTLRPAFEGDDRQRLLCRIVADDPPPPRQHNPSIPRDLETIVLKATAKEPSQRYATAQQMADDLRRYLDDKPIRARRPSLVERGAKWSRRHKPVVRSAAVLLLAAVIATVVVAWNRYQRVLQIEQHLTAAGAFLQSGDYVAADRELTEARRRFDAVLYPSGGLAADLAGLTAQVSGKKEAEERFHRFQEYRQSVHANMYNATPNTMDRAQEKCRAALALYRVFDSDRLEGQEGFELLSPQRRAMLKEAVAELLFAWAEMEAAKEQEPKDLPEAHRRTIAALERIERVYRPIPAVYLWIAQSRRALGEADAARQADQQAAAHRPVSGLDYFILGEFHFMCEDQPEKALADYSLALRRQPDHYLSLLATGLTLWKLRRHNEAVAMLTGAIAVNPRTSIAYIWRANSCWKLRQFDLAQADFDAAVAIDPRDYHAFWGLAQLRQLQGDDAAALAMWDKAVALAPTTPPSLLLERGQFHVQLGNRDKALADFTCVIEWLRPRLGLSQSIRRYRGAMAADPIQLYFDTCYERSKIYRQLGQLDKAEDDLKEALRLTPKSSRDYNARGFVEAERGEFDKAIADFTEAIRLDPKSALAYSDRGVVQIEKGATDEGLRDFSKVLELASHQPKAWGLAAGARLAAGRLDEYRSTCVAMLERFGQPENREDAGATAWVCVWASDAVGDWAKVVALAEEAQKRAPKSGVCQTTLGAVLFRAGRFEEAVQHLTEADRLVPEPTERSPLSPAETWYFLAMAHHRAGHAEEAKKWLDKANAWTEKALREHETFTGPRLDFYRRTLLKRFRAEAAELLGK